MTDFVCSPVRGAGKSSFLESRAESYLRNGHTVIDFFGCYSEDTQLETATGWKPFKNVTKNDQIATLTISGEREYHQPYALQEYDYEGEMVHIKNQDKQFDVLVTPDHRLLLEHIEGHRCIRRAYELYDDSRLDEKYTQWRLLVQHPFHP